MQCEKPISSNQDVGKLSTILYDYLESFQKQFEINDQI